MKTRMFQTLITLFVVSLAACETGSLEAQYEPSLNVADVGTGNDANKSIDSADAAKTDVEPTKTVCVDNDKDGYCAVDKTGKVIDCNDSSFDADGDGIVDGAKFYPGALDICDGLDNDCDGKTDEDAAVLLLYKDSDGDGFGTGEVQKTCNPIGFSAKAGDCNDKDKSTHPGAKDEPNDGIDSDCDDEPEEVDGLPAQLRVETSKKNILSLSYELVSTWGGLGKGKWMANAGTEYWSESVEAPIPDVADTCAIRFSLSSGGGSGNETWSCLGNGANAALNKDLVKAVELKVGSYTGVFEGDSLKDLKIWSDPSGQGCSLVIVWQASCLPPNK